MATLTFGSSPAPSGSRWMERFRATDAWVVSAWEAAAAMAPGGAELTRQLRQGALDCGASLVAAAQCGPGPAEVSYLQRVRARLMEARYVLYLARRFGSIDSKRYRQLSAALDRAMREVAARDGP